MRAQTNYLIVQIAHKLFHSDLFARIVESPHSRLSEADARPIFAQMAEGNYVQFHSITSKSSVRLNVLTRAGLCAQRY